MTKVQRLLQLVTAMGGGAAGPAMGAGGAKVGGPGPGAGRGQVSVNNLGEIPVGPLRKKKRKPKP